MFGGFVRVNAFYDPYFRGISCYVIIVVVYGRSPKHLIPHFPNITVFHQAIKMDWLYRITKLDTISISSDLLVSESIIIMQVICTTDRAICPRKAVYLSNSQFVYIGSAAIDVLGAFFLVASSIASADYINFFYCIKNIDYS